jgi:hypothetical protein
MAGKSTPGSQHPAQVRRAAAESQLYDLYRKRSA